MWRDRGDADAGRASPRAGWLVRGLLILRPAGESVAVTQHLHLGQRKRERAGEAQRTWRPGGFAPTNSFTFLPFLNSMNVGIYSHQHHHRPLVVAHEYFTQCEQAGTYRTNADLLAHVRDRVNVDLAELNVGELRLELLEDGADDSAGAAPCRPEVDNDVFVLAGLWHGRKWR